MLTTRLYHTLVQSNSAIGTEIDLFDKIFPESSCLLVGSESQYEILMFFGGARRIYGQLLGPRKRIKNDLLANISSPGDCNLVTSTTIWTEFIAPK